MNSPTDGLRITGFLAEIAAALDEITRRARSAFGGKFNVDNLGQLADISADSHFIVRVVRGDKPTGFFRSPRRFT